MTGFGSFIGARSARIAAPSTAKPGLRNSEGWNVIQPKSIQRLAPRTSLPVNSTSTHPIIASAKVAAATIFSWCSDRIDTLPRMKTATAAKATCLAA